MEEAHATAGPGTTVLREARELAREFARTYPERDKSRQFPREEMARIKASHLMVAPVPTKYGGFGLSVPDMIRCLMALAEGNPSVSQVYAVHSGMVSTIDEFGTEEQRRRLFSEVVGQHVFLGNAVVEKQSKTVMALETRFEPTPNGNGVVINGRKFFATGCLAADYFWIVGFQGQDLVSAFVPRSAKGLAIADDWDAMGQRGTASGTVELKDVFVERDLVLPKFDLVDPDPSSLVGLLYQASFTAIYVGIAKGAIQHANSYVKTKTRPWVDSGVASAVDDPYVLHSVGHMHAYLSAAEHLLLRAADLVEEARSLRGSVDRSEMSRRRAEAAVAVAEAKLVSTEVSLRVCQDIFQVCGARSALAEEDFDRFWRDIRTLTLHDPKDYKAKLIGEHVLQGKEPRITLYN